MQRRSLGLLLGSGAAVLAAAVPTSAWVHGASAGTSVHKASRTASHWFVQIEPVKGRIVVLRNGSTPTSAGQYQIAVRVTSRHHRLVCFVEQRDGIDLGQSHTIAAGNTAPVILVTDVPAGTQYNLICDGTTQSRQALKGTITETSR
jgi:rhodanese-related sulfurtransferase